MAVNNTSAATSPDREFEAAAAAALNRGYATPGEETAAGPRGFRPSGAGARIGDRVYVGVITLASLSIFGIILMLAWQLASSSLPSIQKFGAGYVSGHVWDEVQQTYSILPFIFGTLYSSLIALLLAVPVSIGAAIFLSELAPRWIRTPVTFLIELLAAIPSVVYGLWGIFVMLPWLKAHVMKPLADSPVQKVPVIGTLLSGAAIGPSMLAAGVVLAIMVVPFITAVTRDILRAIPRAQREGSYGLGATWWETISRVVLPYARSGIIGAVILGLGRALGETMAVTMVIGNNAPESESGISWRLFDPGYTMSSALANKFNEASPGISTAALVEIGLVLFVVTIIVNALARLLIFYTAKDVQGRK
jgi:phosphate transport system permease protein